MGWFDSQIEQRKRVELDLVNESFQKMAQAVVGHKIGDGSFIPEGADVKDAISRLLQYFDIKEKEVPAKCRDLEDQLDFQLATSGVMYREVVLEKGWHVNSFGAMIAKMRDGTVITLIPATSGGYSFVDPKSGHTVKVTASVEKTIGEEAFCFYKPFPMRAMKLKDLFKYMLACLNMGDLIAFGIAALIITLVGLGITKLNQILFGAVLQYQSYQLLVAVASFLLCLTVGSLLFTVTKSILLARISTKLTVSVDAATMMRVLSLPADFFKDYSSGELNQYIGHMNSICTSLIESILSSSITGVFSLIYIGQFFALTPSLVLPAVIITVASLGISLVTAKVQSRDTANMVPVQAKENGLTYSLISGIRKVRLSGAENRAFAKWADIFSTEITCAYDPPLILKISSVLISAISLIGTIVLYIVAIRSNVPVADYFAFNNSFAYMTTAFTAISSIASSAGTIKPLVMAIKPLLDAVPESGEGKEAVTSITGGIEFSHVSFRYTENGPWVIDDLTLNIAPRSYVAIVGKTGCGKSTLIRLLMGFELPTKGTIFYGNKDTRLLDMRSVRKQIGTVMQDARLFGGSLFENITISDPTLTLDDAWEAAEIAGMADSIREMPMGMNTMLQEGTGSISGGQRQRLIIARAVATKPKLLLLDEATSALDNITQKKVADALDKMKCTRIVIAHRLSTIKNCDRILVLDKGHIIEEGTYDELIAKGGYFAELVEKQRVD